MVAGLCDDHRAEQRRKDEDEDRAAEFAEFTSGAGTRIQSSCFGCALVAMAVTLILLSLVLGL